MPTPQLKPEVRAHNSSLKPNLSRGLAARTDAQNRRCEKLLHTPSWKGSTRITESNSCIHTGPPKIQANVWERWTPAAWGLLPFPSVPALQSVILWEVQRKIVKYTFISLQKLPGRRKSFGLWLVIAPVQWWLEAGVLSKARGKWAAVEHEHPTLLCARHTPFHLNLPTCYSFCWAVRWRRGQIYLQTQSGLYLSLTKGTWR